MVEGGISLWFCDFADIGKDTVDALANHLSPPDAGRLQHLVRPESRHQKIVSRALVRAAAEAYLDRPLEAADIVFGAGKPPALRAGFSDASFHMSVSHSGTGVMVAIGGNSRVGVDLQQSDRPRAWRAIVEMSFSESEKALLQTVAAERGEALFYKLWCLKEAFAKASDTELAEALKHDFSDAVIEESGSGPAPWHETGGHPGYWMTAWFQGPYAAALASERPEPVNLAATTPEGILADIDRRALSSS